MSQPVILVPTDFTKVADTALSHAVRIARQSNSEIKLIHVVDNADEVKATKKIIEDVAERAAEWYKLKVSGAIRIGNIFEDIGDAAAELDAKLVIMGTHGLKGIQHLVGGYALKVITHSQIPFIVVQEAAKEGNYKRIVVPLDLSKDTKQKLGITARLAELFHSEIKVISPKTSDEFLNNQIFRNIAFTKKFLSERNIPHTTEIIDLDGSFANTVIGYAKKVDADLISIMSHQTMMFSNIFGESYQQKVLTNDAGIPVIAVNPKPVTV
ncbi:MAG: universal stress protein [Salibacteraceae bacterium]